MWREACKALPTMNTHAVSLVLEGRLAEAMSLFNICFDLATQLYERGYLPANAGYAFSDESSLAPVSLEEVMHSYDPSNHTSPQNCFIFFRNLFVLEGTDALRSREQATTLAQIVLFNLAVVWQELGLGNADIKFLSEASRLYQKMLERFTQPSSDTSISLLEMSLYNNLGHTFFFFSDKEGVLEMRSRLNTLLDWSSQQSDYWGFRSFFQCSLIQSLTITTTTAPAA